MMALPADDGEAMAIDESSPATGVGPLVFDERPALAPMAAIVTPPADASSGFGAGAFDPLQAPPPPPSPANSLGSVGSVSRPKGRAPRGCAWDAERGVWVPDAVPGSPRAAMKPRAGGAGRLLDASTGQLVAAGKTTRLPSSLSTLVGRDILKLFQNVATEDLEWYSGTIVRLLDAPDLAQWRLPAPRKASQAWAQVRWRGDPSVRVTNMLFDESTFPFVTEGLAPGTFDPANAQFWAVLLEPTTFAYTSKGQGKMLRPGLWKLVDLPVPSLF
mmetsp:Transcript_17699/g.52641  ORF Transcript_17699/g.52641 Transcript_17699/m.52641 type:complete len:273 (+) Transcript_17699:142-960(+)